MYRTFWLTGQTHNLALVGDEDTPPRADRIIGRPIVRRDRSTSTGQTQSLVLVEDRAQLHRAH